MRTVSPGQPFSMSADEFNSFQEAAQFVRTERTRRGVSNGIGNTIDRTQPLVVSESSESIRAFSAVKITGIQEKPGGGPTDDFISLTPLKVDKPTSEDDSFLIVQDGLSEQGTAARAITDGITPAWVTFGSGDNEETAGPDENSFDLKAGNEGAKVIWKPDGTGSLLCVVRVGNAAGSKLILGKLTTALPEGGSASVDVYSNPTTVSETLEGVKSPPWHTGDDWAVDAWVEVFKWNDDLYARQLISTGSYEEQDITYVSNVECVDGDIVGSTTTKTVLVPASEE